MAIESSGITLISGALSGLVIAIDLSRATMRNIRQNLVFAFVYNGIGIPVAAGLLYPAFGLRLSPMMAAGAMAASSLSVVANANRLRASKPAVIPDSVRVHPPTRWWRWNATRARTPTPQRDNGRRRGGGLHTWLHPSGVNVDSLREDET